MFPSSIRNIKSVNPYEGFESPVNFDPGAFGSHRCDYSHIALLNVYAAARGLSGLEYKVIDNVNPEALLENGKDIATIFRANAGYYNDSLLIIGVDSSSEEKSIEEIEDAENWVECKDIALYLKERSMIVRPFVNETERAAIVLIRNINLPVFHIVGYFLSRFVPWWFEEAPLTQKEKETAKTLLDKTSTEFIERVNALAEELFDIRGGRIRALLGGYMEGAAERLMKQKRDGVRDRESRIGTLLEEIRDLRRRITEDSMYIAGLKTVSTDTTELVEYCTKSKNIDVVRLDGSKITFGVKAELCNFDEDVVEMCLKNDASYIYEIASGRGVDKDKAKKFLEKVFFEGEYVLHLYAEYEVDFFNKSVRGLRIESNEDHPECLLNRHISRHACLGGNEALLHDFIQAGDFTGTMNMLVATTGNININEAASNDRFFSELFSTDKKIVTVRETGEVITFAEATMEE